MDNPTIADAKALATKLRRRGVIVLAFGESDFALASYGMTRAECDAMRDVADQIADAIEMQEIEIPGR